MGDMGDTFTYILVGQTPVPEPDPIKWAQWFEDSERHVALTRVMDIAVVSTVFLGLDHNHMRFLFPDEPPILFESMIFWEGEGGDEQDRCSTWKGAEVMHQEMVQEAGSPRVIFGHYLRMAREAWSRAWGELREAVKRV